jgi:hypothetical protein
MLAVKQLASAAMLAKNPLDLRGRALPAPIRHVPHQCLPKVSHAHPQGRQFRLILNQRLSWRLTRHLALRAMKANCNRHPIIHRVNPRMAATNSLRN